MTFATYFNPTSSPVVIDDTGATIAGGTWGTASSSTRQVSAAVDNGSLVEVPRPDDTSETNPDALAAFDRTATLNAPSTPAGKRQAPPSDPEEK